MNWIQNLYATKPPGSAQGLDDTDATFTPESHTTAKAHVEVVLDPQGGFFRASLVPKHSSITCIPCTEDSGSRSGIKPKPHPLCDSLQYLAKNFRDYGGEVTKGFQNEDDEPHKSYRKQLESWVEQAPHPTTRAVLTYLKAGTLLKDLGEAGVLPFENGKFVKSKPDGTDVHPVWALLAADQLPEGAVVRWRVHTPGQESPGSWEDTSLIDNWSDYYPKSITKRSLCMVTGEELSLASLHPAKLRHGADKAKIISANDSSGFTFRGRFTDTDGAQACGVGYSVTQKAHSALRWLIARQGYRNGNQVFVSWAVSGAPVPQPLEDTYEWLDEILEPDQLQEPTIDNAQNAGLAFAQRLMRYIAGYEASLGDDENILVMGLDSATPGRMSIIYSRNLRKSEFLTRLQAWHLELAWQQYLYFETSNSQRAARPISKGHWLWRVCAPSPRAIAEAAYGPPASKDKEKKLLRATVERILPCIVDGRPLPDELVNCCVRRASNRVSQEPWEWRKTLGVACALFKGHYARHHNPDQRRYYSMALEPERTSRDYLFGRLLAVAEHVEDIALHVGGENRPTTAGRLMQRFADHPATTWRTIELSLQPYTQRLQARRGGFLHKMRVLLDEVYGLFVPEDFIDDRPLSGEFLLGYHCQRQVLKAKPAEIDAINEGE